MSANYSLPPDPQQATLKRIYPWDEYNVTLVMQWLYEQAQKTGFNGTFEDFKQRYGTSIANADPHDIYDFIENYTGPYHITPLENIEQRLRIKNKIANQDIIIDPIPDALIGEHGLYKGRYEVTPMANFDQFLRTKDKILEDDITIEKIPYSEVSNTSGGTTVIIG